MMLKRAPSLQWLLEASFSELQEMFPQISHKVIKLFSDITAKSKLKPASPENENEPSLLTNNTAYPPHPHLPPKVQDFSTPQSDPQACHSQQSMQFTLSLSEQKENKTPPSLFRESIGQPLCFREDRNEDNISAGHFRRRGEESWQRNKLSLPDHSLTHSCNLLTSSQFSQSSATMSVWQPQREEHMNSNPNPVLGQAVPQVSMKPLLTPEVLGCSNSVFGFGSGLQALWSSPESCLSQETGEERKRQGEDLHSGTHILLPQCKRGKLLCERVPGRNDGQTRLRFF
ncbi:uncharacterized protein LOC127430521 [Myxocyprinus asiaticus]|uniref:uncharacterized protein LOC127430521 n=1 Tax=Myxocyprinus asiaticus TaxID=70543 RepID=UPI002221729D|nr:uncharacterized protein LOC127430521 [Myxocyprinus asiaticus]